MNQHTDPGHSSRQVLVAISAALAVTAVVLLVASVVLLQSGHPQASASLAPTDSGVSYLPSATPSETLVSPSPHATVSLGPSLSPTPGVPASASPSPSPSPSPSASPTPVPVSAFVRASGFPARGENIVRIIAGGPGFVAVGNADDPTADCPDRVDGHIWTSPDGRAWTRRDADALGDTSMRDLVATPDGLYALGYADRAADGDCPDATGAGTTLWSSSDGLSWQQEPGNLADLARYGELHLTAAGGTLIVTSPPSGDSNAAGVWLSTNGMSWRPAQAPPATPRLVVLAALGNTVIGFGEGPADGLAWYSTDAGDTWKAAKLPFGYDLLDYSLVAANGRFVVGADACCDLPGHVIGIELTSTDGRQWTFSTPHANPASGVAALPSGFVGVTAAGETLVSGDGQNWLAGPFGRVLDPNTAFIAAAGGGPLGVVMVTNERNADGSDLTRGWFAPAGAFDPGAASGSPAPAQQPAIGVAYAYSLFTHCGIANNRVTFGGSTWALDSATGHFAEADRGTLTMLTADTARYKSKRGGVALYHRSSGPVPYPGPCA